jgi:predicted Rossmann-fold nucleotide-binding protein
VRHFPVVLVTSDYWSGLVDWMRDRMLGSGNISPEDMDLFTVTDDLDQVLEIVSAASHRQARRPR